MEKEQLQKFFQLKSEDCCREGCVLKAQWQPVFLLFSECESNCGNPHFQNPAVMIQDSGYCDMHKHPLTLEDLWPEPLWERLCGDFRGRGINPPRKDWTAISFHKIPENVIHMGPRLVPKNPEPLPPSA